MNNKLEKVGVIGVDAGLCWIGDPCYVLHKEAGTKYEDIGNDWREFCDKLGEDYPIAKQFKYDMGHAGLGVCVSTGYGDGTYPVYVRRNKEGRIMEAVIKFIDESDEEDGDDE